MRVQLSLLLVMLFTGFCWAWQRIEPAGKSDPLGPYREAAISRWEGEIQKLEELDRKESNPPDSVLFLGSSSIRRWNSLAQDLAPWPTIRRGYGGARFSDLAVFIDRLTQPHEFDALVIFVGNDIAGKPEDKSPEQVVELFQYVVERVRTHHSQQPIFLLAVTPTSSRFDVWPRVARMNNLLKAHCESEPGLHFIETAYAFLGPDGTPNDTLFVEDRLHLNREGYRVWAEIIKEHLTKVQSSDENRTPPSVR